MIRLCLLAFATLATPALATSGPLLAQACAGCHGPNAAGQEATPGIAGLPAATLIAQMQAFRANERPATIMGRIARGYSEAEITAIAEYLATRR